jgi:hypothetical protein
MHYKSTGWCSENTEVSVGNLTVQITDYARLAVQITDYTSYITKLLIMQWKTKQKILYSARLADKPHPFVLNGRGKSKNEMQTLALKEM